MTRSTFLHLRFPFSFFLLPVFLFGLSVAKTLDLSQVLLVFFVLHFLLYPASNGYNSYFDKDEESIGGLKNPPKTTQELYWTALGLDALAMVLGLLISWQFSLMLLVYGLVSKSYSHPLTRLKKRPIVGWLAVGVFQGWFTFLMTLVGVMGLGYGDLWVEQYQIPGLLSSSLLLGSYPMTQIYQHREDQKRGDETISLKLGIKGTFLFTAVFFLFSNGGFLLYFWLQHSVIDALYFQLAMTPVMIYFFNWFFKVLKSAQVVNYSNTMGLNWISSVMLNAFFLLLIFG